MRTTWRPFAWVSAALCAGTMGTALASHKPKAGQIASMFSLYGSLAPSFLEEMIPWSGPAISGTATASGLFISGCTQFLLRSQPLHRALYLGMLFLLLACLALGLIL